MSLPNSIIFTARTLLLLCLLTITWLATGEIHSTLIHSINDKVNHIAAFYALAIIIDFAFPHHRFGSKKFFLLVMYGLLLELIQHNLPYRHFSLFDLLADVAGILIYLFSIPLLKNLPLLKQRWI